MVLLPFDLSVQWRHQGLEGDCAEDGELHYKYWNEADGRIGRSLRFDTRNNGTLLGMVSIIIDAKKTGLMK